MIFALFTARSFHILLHIPLCCPFQVARSLACPPVSSNRSSQHSFVYSFVRSFVLSFFRSVSLLVGRPARLSDVLSSALSLVSFVPVAKRRRNTDFATDAAAAAQCATSAAAHVRAPLIARVTTKALVIQCRSNVPPPNRAPANVASACNLKLAGLKWRQSFPIHGPFGLSLASCASNNINNSASSHAAFPSKFEPERGSDFEASLETMDLPRTTTSGRAKTPAIRSGSARTAEKFNLLPASIRYLADA